MTKNDYYLWGAGLYGGRLIEILKDDFTFKAVIDNDPKKKGNQFYGLPVVSYDEIKKDLPKTKIAIAINLPTTVREFLMSEGFTENQDFFILHEFLPRYFWSKNRMLATKNIDMAVTNVCTMKCPACQTFIPFTENPGNKKIEEIINDIDMAFSYIDIVVNVNICIGESLLNEELPIICSYIKDNYAEKYFFLAVQTNGTVMPKDDVLKQFSNSNTVFGIAGYPENESMRNSFIKKLDEHGISWYINSASERESSWVNFGDPRVVNETDQKKLCERYKGCWKPRSAVYDGRLYLCVIQHYYHTSVGHVSLEPGDTFDLRKPKTEESREELYKLLTAQSERGYISHCMRCNSVLNRLYKGKNKK